MAKESNRARQCEELEVIKCIYGNDVEDLRSGNSGWKPIDLRILLFPSKVSDISEAFVETKLRVTCSHKYPEIAPKLSLEETKGISDSLIEDLIQELNLQASKLKGEVMIFELIQTVKSFLHKHNKPPKGSFYDEMLQQKFKRYQKLKEEEQEQRDRERQNLLEEVERRKELFKTEAKPTRLISNEISANECPDHGYSDMINFPKSGKQIRRGCCLGHSQNGYVAFSGVDIDTGKLFYITEWHIKYSQIEAKCQLNCFWSSDSKCNGHNVTDFINCVEKHVRVLSQMHHNNIAAYERVLCSNHKECVIINLVQDFVLGNNVRNITNSIGWCIEGVRVVAKEVLEALVFLHNRGISYSYLCDTTVFIDNFGKVRCTDFSLVPHLLELTTGERQKDGDLPALGSLIESLMPVLSSDMKDFVDKCKSDRTLSASELLEHPFLRRTMCLEEQKDNLFNFETSKNNLLKTNLKKDINNSSHNADRLLIPLYSNLTINIPQSRLSTEFEILQYLEKGAFGDVLKVRNILDNREYAIKRIPLSAKSRQLYRKMTREVELLSRLNHENVVRYFNSWIENAMSNEADDIDKESNEEMKRLSPYNPADSEESSSSIWKGFLQNVDDSDSDGIEFVNSDGEVVVYDECEASEDEDKHYISSPKPLNQVMYIQMEFCEKSTLRQAIDDNLCENTDRLWRLFREILEGLSHIHQQGIIHRDLKPANIFLDSRDQIKIGDFGLATTSFLALQSNEHANISNVKDDGTNTGTGTVGTALYVAPELTGNASKSTYNQKVDMYTLGIILFEMSHPPFETAMERIKTILDLRSKNIVLPEKILKNPRYDQNVKIIQWLLKHDPSQRPAAEELLLSDLMPPAQLETSELQEIVRHILANPQSKGYKNLVARCLQQESDDVLELTYHLGLLASNPVLEFVKEKVVNLFRKHGGVEMNAPLLTPLSKNIFSNSNPVKLMTHSGSVVVLPNNLRVLFARHVAMSGINVMRRYSIDRTYREKKVFNFHPKQSYECAFDIITPNPGNFLADAELISMAYEIASEIPHVKEKNLSIRMNHTNLLKSILLYCNVPKHLYSQLFANYLDYIDGRLSKFHFTSAVATILQTSKTSATTLIDLLLIEFAMGGPRGHMDNTVLKALVKGKGESAKLAKNALRELECVVSLSQSLGVNCPIHICAGLPISYDRACSGGIVWQMIAILKLNRTPKPSVLAVGERYDTMLTQFQQQAHGWNVSIPHRGISGAGFSFYLDKLATLIGSEWNENFRTIDVVICVSGTKPPLKDVTYILKLLWSAGIRSGVVESAGFDEVEDLAKDLGAAHVIFLGENGVLKVRSWDREHFQERHVTRSELVDYIQKLLARDNFNVAEVGILHQITDKQVAINSNLCPGTKNQDFISGLPNVDVTFLTQEKITANMRKRLENQVTQHMQSTLVKFSRKEYFLVMIVDLPSIVVNAIVGAINPRKLSLKETEKEISYIVERFPKHKRYISDILDDVIDAMSVEKNTPIVALYSTIDSYFRIII
ncbi:eIF-2-alpha kinase GCN2 [Condylostylus longicornis]|uniref:eIF-2-alpha kinase GCN2 n=1 Tax=Condylostylus longicornis TaxID=2530218 RepID=UPI00244E24AB|nr:eIF-2-alpha kinase GCN2 [Condylostylus longicornis]